MGKGILCLSYTKDQSRRATIQGSQSNLSCPQGSVLGPLLFLLYVNDIWRNIDSNILCILIVRPCILNVVYVFLLWSMYSYCPSMYSYCCPCILIVVYVFLDAAILTEVFPCFFLGCKANARVILAKTGHGPHFSKFVVLLYVLLFVLFYVLFVCKCVLPPGDNPIAVNKYIISY